MQGTIGEIRMFSGNYAPQSWAFCRGQLLSITAYPILYDIVGTTFGGDGINDFALPDFMGRSPIGVGHGSGLSNITDGQTGGAESITLTTSQMPAHNHSASATVSGTVSPKCLDDTGLGDSPGNAYPAIANPATDRIYTSAAQLPDAVMASSPISATATVTIGNTGASDPVPVRNPFAAINYIICIEAFVPVP
ncbi:MAG: tail fiber protein [Chitinophagaceae bacterium]